MIPLRDNVKHRRFPLVTFALIIANVAVFIYELTLGQRGLTDFVYTYGFVPAKMLADVSLAEKFLPAYTSMFLHGSIGHLFGNMLFLWIFADNVEDRMGWFSFFVFYILCGFAATAAHYFMNIGSKIPAVGASGAIAGVLGAYFVLYPRARVATLVPIFFFYWRVIEIPAFIFLGIWFIYQFLQGLVVASTAAAVGIAFWAHIGGFLAGLILVWFFKRG